MSPKRLLVLSDGKPGHLNQSIAFARCLNCAYDVVPVSFAHPLLKGASYLLDRIGLYLPGLFCGEPPAEAYDGVVSAGSTTYYANKVLARQLDCPAIAMMMPRGYRLTFDLVVAQQHDRPPKHPSIVALPINVTWVEPNGLVKKKPADPPVISLIVGGGSGQAIIDGAKLKDALEQIFRLFPDHQKWITTSRRTPVSVEAMLQSFGFDVAFYYSQQTVNPVGDFLQQSEVVFLTDDSSSMISEAVSFGSAAVEVLPVLDPQKKPAKMQRFLQNLVDCNAAHRFDGTCGDARHKITLGTAFEADHIHALLQRKKR